MATSAKSEWVSQYRTNTFELLRILKELRELKKEAVALNYVATLTDADCSEDAFDVSVQNMVDAVGAVDAVETALTTNNTIGKLYLVARRM